MKRTPLKKASKIPRLKLRKKADTLWGELIKLRAGNRCEKCGRNGMVQSHHIWTRENLHMRHDPQNGVCLCPRCHTFDPKESAHLNPENFRDWLIKRKGQRWFDKMKALSFLTVKPDYQGAITFLEQELKKVKGEKDA